jgi:hypothetical protein
MARCESCGMPLKPEVQAVEKDGSLSNVYCKNCYAQGAFLHPKATVEEMRKYSIEGMVKGGWPRFLAKFMTLGMNKLPRWKQEDSSKPVVK